MEDRLYYVEGPDGEVLGPMSMIQILEGIAAEAIQESARICEVGRQEWIEISDVVATREDETGEVDDFEEMEELGEPEMEEGVPIETELVDSELSEHQLHEIQSAVLQEMDRDSRATSGNAGKPIDSTAYSEEPVIINPDAYFSPMSMPPAAEESPPLEIPTYTGPQAYVLDSELDENMDTFDEPSIEPIKVETPAPGRPPASSTILSEADFATSEELASSAFSSPPVESEDPHSKDEWVEDFRLEMQEAKSWDEPEPEVAPGPAARAGWLVPMITAVGVLAILVVYFMMARGKHEGQAVMVPPDPTADQERREEAKGYYESARVRLSQNDAEGAIPSLTKALEIDPRYAEARKDLAHALLATGREGLAIDELSKYLLEAPDDIESQRQRLDWMLKTGKQAEAAVIYGGLANSRRDSAPIQTMAGLAKGTTEDAVGYLRRAIELDPSDVEAMNALGQTYVALGRHAEAVKTFEAAFALRRPTEELLKVYGVAKKEWKSTEPEEPVAAARSAQFSSTIDRIRKSLQQENYAAARAEIASAQKKFAKDGEATRNLKLWNGIVHFEEGQFEQALDVFEGIDQDASYEASGWGRGAAANWIARTRLANGDLRGAVQAFDLVKGADPDEMATARLWEGVALQKLGMGDVAKRTWQQIPEEMGRHVQGVGKGAVKTAQFLSGVLTEKEYQSSVSAIAGFENDMHYFLGRIALERADSLSASEHFRQALESSHGKEFPYFLAKEETTAKGRKSTTSN